MRLYIVLEYHLHLLVMFLGDKLIDLSEYIHVMRNFGVEEDDSKLAFKLFSVVSKNAVVV